MCWLAVAAFPQHIFSRPGRSQRPLYKHRHHALIHWFVRLPLPLLALRRWQAQTVWDVASSHKIDYVYVFLNLKVYQNCIIAQVQKLRQFSLIGGFCLFVELNKDLFLTHRHFLIKTPVLIKCVSYSMFYVLYRLICTRLSSIREGKYCPAPPPLLLLRHAQATPPIFWNGWRQRPSPGAGIWPT